MKEEENVNICLVKYSSRDIARDVAGIVFFLSLSLYIYDFFYKPLYSARRQCVV